MTATDELAALRAALEAERAARAAAERRAAALEAERAAAAAPPGAAPGDQAQVLLEALDHIDGGFWELDATTGATTWSEGMYRLLGYAPGEVTPSNAAFAARVHPDDLAGVFAVPVGRRFVTECRVLLPGGEARWVRSVNTAALDEAGRPLRIRGLLADVTADKRIERERERLAEVARRTQNAVVVTDRDGRVEWVNEGFTRLTGYALADVAGRRPGAVLQGPDTDPETRAEMGRAFAAGEPFRVVVLNYARDGRQYWVEIDSQPTSDERGALTGYIAIETDVTERRIQAARESLAERVAALLLRCDSVEEAGRRVVEELVRELDVRAAQLWVVDPASPTLVYLAGACADPRGAPWVETSRGLAFRRGDDWVVGVGAPGAAWGRGEAYVRVDFWSMDAAGQPSRRAVAARAAGIRTVCAVPVKGPGGVLAVLEIGGSHSYPGYDRLPSLLERLAEQLAAFILQEASRRAFASLFRHSPDALLQVGPDGRVLAANARAIALFGAPVGAEVRALLDDVEPAVAAALAAAPDPAAGQALLRRAAHRPDGGAFPAELTIAATTSAAGAAAILAIRDLTERDRMEAALTRSLREKEVLIQEVHHRVKNNLQIISSMIALQADAIASEDVRAALLDTVHRVHSMALVHQHLYGNDDLATIRLDDYARALCGSLQSSLAPEASFAFDAAPIALGIERAVPCGLILNELVTNALKHGRSEDGRCELRIAIERTPAGFAFEVADRGRGMEGAVPSSASIGQKLIGALVRQLRARRTVTSAGGTTVRVEVPDATDA